MAVKRSRIHKEAFKAAVAFYDSGIWKHFSDSTAIGVEAPGEKHLMLASIMGQGGTEHGLMLLRGPDAAEHFAQLLSADASDREETRTPDIISFSMTPVNDINPQMRTFFKKAGVSGRPGSIVPFFMARPSGGVTREPTVSEVRTFLCVLRGFLKAYEGGMLRPGHLPGDPESPLLTLSGDPFDPDVICGTMPCPPSILAALGAEGWFSEGEPSENAVPESDDLDGWKAADRRLARRLNEHSHSSRATSPLAMRRYFGDAERGEYLIEACEDYGVLHAYAEWVALDYRPEPDSLTAAEHILDGELPDAEKLLLEARCRSRPSIYRIADTEPGSILVEDILLGGKTMVYDRNLSMSARPGLFLPARVFPAGNFHFIIPAGPPLTPMSLPHALDELEAEGLRPTEEGLKQGAHLFGRLWDWFEETQHANVSPHLTTMDGEPLAWHTATYRVSDEADARGAIAERSDIEFDAPNGQYIWVERSLSSAALSGARVLATLTFIGDELLVEVMSTERISAARAWLDTIKGLHYESVRTRDILNENPADRPPDDRLACEAPMEMTPELLAHATGIIHEHYMKWLDMPLPVLGGKTPRDACSTKSGRRKVATLIRALPPPMANLRVDIPREQMLRELGLTAE